MHLQCNEPRRTLPSCCRENGNRPNTFRNIARHTFTRVRAEIGETLAERERRLEGVPEIHYHISLNKYSEDFLLGKIDRETSQQSTRHPFSGGPKLRIFRFSHPLPVVYLSCLSLSRSLSPILSLPLALCLYVSNIHVLWA